jgi:ABC-type branched-subunit amino acid transport system ATPase component
MTPSPEDAVVADRLEKRFGSTVALAGLSFSVKPAELFGVVGPDGGGKTTLFRILATLMVSDKGAARVLGRDVVKDMRSGAYAGRLGKESAAAAADFVVVDMFAEACTGQQTPKEAAQRAETRARRLYRA